MSDPFFINDESGAWLELGCVGGHIYNDPDFDDDDAFVSISAQRDGAFMKDPDVLERFAQIVTDAAAWLRSEQARLAAEKAKEGDHG